MAQHNVMQNAINTHISANPSPTFTWQADALLGRLQQKDSGRCLDNYAIYARICAPVD